MIISYFKTIKGRKFKQIAEFRSGCWINVTETNADEVNQIAQLLHTQYENLQDSLDQYEVPRLERVNGDLYLFVRTPAETISGLYTQSLTIVVSKRYLITISPNKNLFVETLLQSNPALATTQQSKLLLYILTRLAKDFTVNVKQVNDRMMRQKKNVGTVSDADITTLIQSEEVLSQYLSALAPMEVMFKNLVNGSYLKQYEEDKDLYEDVLIAISQALNLCTVTVKSIVSLRDSYQIIFSNKLNRTIRFLTSITIILTLPTIIASIFGMNVALPLADNPHAFGIIILITVLTAVTMLTIFFRKNWL